MYYRRSIRLEHYDYAQQGAYFVTICTHEQRCVFGDVVDGVMVINGWGRIAQEQWEQTGVLRSSIELDAFVVMPNHIHGIIVISDDRKTATYGRGMMYHALPNPNDNPSEREFSKPVAHSLSTIVGAYKAAVTRQIYRLAQSPRYPVWQRNYYEHVIRSEESLNTIRAYVANNPARWEADSLFVRS